MMGGYPSTGRHVDDS